MFKLFLTFYTLKQKFKTTATSVKEEMFFPQLEQFESQTTVSIAGLHFDLCVIVFFFLIKFTYIPTCFTPWSPSKVFVEMWVVQTRKADSEDAENETHKCIPWFIKSKQKQKLKCPFCPYLKINKTGFGMSKRSLLCCYRTINTNFKLSWPEFH